MAVSMRDLDPAFQSAGQKAGLEIWCIENSNPVLVPPSSYGKFSVEDCYVILKTLALKSGSFRHEIYYWLGEDTSSSKADAAAIKAVELDATLGGRSVQYREVQGYESDKFLSYFRPCIIPQKGVNASGINHDLQEGSVPHLYLCRGKHVVHVKEVPFSRSSLSHDDIFILDTKHKIFQFNGYNTSIQERAKALSVVQYFKDTYHSGKCDIAAIEDGKLMADAETGEFWNLFGGFAPLPRKATTQENHASAYSKKLFSVEKGRSMHIEVDSLARHLLNTNKCYLIDCGTTIYVWMGRSTPLDERKSASTVAEELLRDSGRQKAQLVRMIEGCETFAFRAIFESWPETADVAVSQNGRGKVAALLKRQGLNVKGLTKAAPVQDPQPYIDCTGNLEVWRVNGKSKIPLPSSEQLKFYSGDCYIFQYCYPGDEVEECLIGTWFGKQSTEEEKANAASLASKMIESLKMRPVQARIFEGKEPVQFFAIFQSFIVFKGGLSSGYKKYIEDQGIADETYTENSLALFRIQGSGPDNMQAIQVEPVAASLNSSYCYILQSGSTVFTWYGNFTTSEDHELVERQLDLIKPLVQSKPQKEGTESEQFWSLLGGKGDYPSQKFGKDVESDPQLFHCTYHAGDLKTVEIFNFSQDDLMTEDIFILDTKVEVFVWIGQQVGPKGKMQALTIGEKFLECDFCMGKRSKETPIFAIFEGSEPSFFTRFFTWDAAKSLLHGNSFERKLALVKKGTILMQDKPKRRVPTSYGGRSSVPEKSQRSRSMSFSPDRVRVRGRSPAFNALAAAFEGPNTRNLSTPPPAAGNLYPKSILPDTAKLASRSAAIAALTATFERPQQNNIPLSKDDSPNIKNQKNNSASPQKSSNSLSSRIGALTIQEDVKEGEAYDDDEGVSTFPYERLKVSAKDPISGIDVAKRETYLSSHEFRDKFGMTEESFFKLPKWKQNKLKMTLDLF